MISIAGILIIMVFFLLVGIKNDSSKRSRTAYETGVYNGGNEVFMFFTMLRVFRAVSSYTREGIQS